MSSFLRNKVIIITGSGKGIGKATAFEFCKNGAKVMLNGRDENRLKQTAGEFLQKGFDVDYCVGDITNYDACIRLVSHTIKVFGTVHVLVANGSISMNARFDQMSPELFKDILNSNVLGATMPLFACLDILKQTKGSVIFISSVAGFHGMPTASAYSAGKMALTAIQQSLNIELHVFGVHVGLLYVGFTENDSDKKLFAFDGSQVSVPARPWFLQQKQSTVAKWVLRMVKYRIRGKTLSLTGKTTKFISHTAPWLIFMAGVFAQKNLRKKPP